MTLKITDDTLNDLDEFLHNHQHKYIDWYIFVHDEDYVEVDENCMWIKIPESYDKFYSLWSEGLRRFVNDGDVLVVNPNLLTNLKGMSRLFKNCNVKLTSTDWKLISDGIFNAIKTFEDTRFNGHIEEISITSDVLFANQMFANSRIKSTHFKGSRFVEMTEMFVNSSAVEVCFDGCGGSSVLDDYVSCRDIFTGSQIKKIKFIDCESKLVDSIIYTLNENNEFDNVEVAIEERMEL